MRRSAFLALAVFGSIMTTPVLAQASRAGSNTPEDQGIADRLRFQGSRCDAPACRNDPEGVYPEPDRPGMASTTPSIAGGGQPQSRDQTAR